MVNLEDSALSLYSAIARALLFIFLVICLGIAGYLTGHDFDIPRIRFALAASIIALIYSVGLQFAYRVCTFTYYKYLLFGLDVISFVFVLAAAAAVSDIDDICDSGSIFFVGSNAQCGDFKAVEAFLWLSWVTLIAIVVLEFARLRLYACFARSHYFKKRPTGDIESGVPGGTFEVVDHAAVPHTNANNSNPSLYGHTVEAEVPTNESPLEHAAADVRR